MTLCIERKLGASRAEYGSLRRGRNEIASQTRQMEVDVNNALKAISTILASVCAQMCSAVQEELVNAFRRISTQLGLEARRAIADVRRSLEREYADVDRYVAQCAAVLRDGLEEMNKVSSIAEACINVSTGQGAASKSSPEG